MATIDPAVYDAELRRLDVHFRAAADVRPGDHVLDVGCGAGQTTRERLHRRPGAEPVARHVARSLHSRRRALRLGRLDRHGSPAVEIAVVSPAEERP